LNAHGTSDVRHDVKTRAIVSEVYREVTDLRREVLKGQEGAGGQRQFVSVSRTLSPNTRLPLNRLKIGQHYRPLLGPASYACIQRTWGIPSPAAEGLLWT